MSAINGPVRKGTWRNDGMLRAMLTAHSGCENTEMNSLAYLKKAQEVRPDAIEVDVRVNSDGMAVLDHSGGAATPVPFRQACMTVAGTRIMINADLKQKGIEEVVLQTALSCGLDSGDLIFTGSLADPAGMSRRIGDACVFANPEEFDPAFYHRTDEEEVRESASQVLSAVRACGFDTVNINYRYCTDEFMFACFEKGVRISLWTVDDENAAKRFLAGRYASLIVNITTNYPGMLRRVMKKCGG